MLGIFLDIETTGLDFFCHRSIDFCFKIIDLSNGEEKYTYHSIVNQPKSIWDMRDLSSIAINGFTWEKLSQGKSEIEIKQEIIDIFATLEIARRKAFYICQNPAFDRGFFSQIVDIYTQEKLNWPYRWLDFASMFWALEVKKSNTSHVPLPKEINLSKNAIAEKSGLPIEAMPHSAVNGVNHLILCYQTVVGFGQMLPLETSCS